MVFGYKYNLTCINQGSREVQNMDYRAEGKEYRMMNEGNSLVIGKLNKTFLGLFKETTKVGKQEGKHLSYPGHYTS